jgi:hypothetical protein
LFSLKQKTGRLLAHYLNKPVSRYRPAATTSPDQLLRLLRPCDVLLVEGNRRISSAIKYLTQSTWSHSTLFVGPIAGRETEGPMLVEADLENGVNAVPVSKYDPFHTRICRPVGLSQQEIRQVIDFVVQRIGLQYDLKNVVDLVRYLLPTPPVPVRVRRKMLALGSGDPTRAICSTLIAQAFQEIRYPILPTVSVQSLDTIMGTNVRREVLHIRHHSLFTPREFDVSPYFDIVKPTLAEGFDHRALIWEEDEDIR